MLLRDDLTPAALLPKLEHFFTLSGPKIRALAEPLLRNAAGMADRLTAALLERNRELEAAGYHAQVHVE